MHAGAVHRAYLAVNFLATVRFSENRLRISLLSLFRICAARQQRITQSRRTE
jgi:hypothetical protein